MSGEMLKRCTHNMRYVQLHEFSCNINKQPKQITANYIQFIQKTN